MKKSELEKELLEAINTEESATTIYMQHIKALSTRFEIDDAFIKTFIKTLNYLIEGNKAHRKACENLLAKIKKGKKDDY